MEPASHYLVADTRERHVHALLKTVFDQGGKSFTVAQINTGDYLICRRLAGAPPEILAVIERKTHKDFAASLHDNRYANRHKMLDLRDRTGCQLYFFVEGKAFPRPTSRVGRVPYRSILSAMTNLMVRDGISIVQTANQMHTAQRLYEFVAAFDKTPVPYRAPAAPGGQSLPRSDSGALVPAELTGSIKKDDATLAIEMWACLAGVSVVTAQVLVAAYSVHDFISGRVTREDLRALRSPANRPLTKGALRSLEALRRGKKKEQIKILSGVPGISRGMAVMILDSRDLAGFLSSGAGEVSIRQKGRTVKLGPARAERIRTLLTYRQSRNLPDRNPPDRNPPDRNPPDRNPPGQDSLNNAEFDDLMAEIL